MNFIKRYGKWLASIFIAAGVLLLILSFSLPSQTVYAQVWLEGETEPYFVSVDSAYVANWLGKAGIRVFPQDGIRINGLQVPYDFRVLEHDSYQVLYKPAVPIQLIEGEETVSFNSAADTLAEALWEQGIILKQADWVQPGLETILDRALQVTLRRSRPLDVIIADSKYRVLSAADTVGAALAEAGFPLQGLDYAEPSAESLVPDDAAIRIVRVREEIITEETSIPYSTERIADPDMDVGDEIILQSGVNGIQSSTIRVRVEDGEEVDRELISQKTTQVPLTERIAYGGNIVEQSLGDLDYYYALDVRVTCYGWTGNTTSHGEYPSYGTIAVKLPWYQILKESQIYVPNYGTGAVLDVCPGCIDQPWIDVYTDECYDDPFTYNTTIYLLSPAPPAFTGELP